MLLAIFSSPRRYSLNHGYPSNSIYDIHNNAMVESTTTLDICRHYGDNNKSPTILARELEHWGCLGTVWRLRCPSTVAGVRSDHPRLTPGFWLSLSAWPADRPVAPAAARAWHRVHATESTHGPAGP